LYLTRCSCFLPQVVAAFLAIDPMPHGLVHCLGHELHTMHASCLYFCCLSCFQYMHLFAGGRAGEGGGHHWCPTKRAIPFSPQASQPWYLLCRYTDNMCVESHICLKPWATTVRKICRHLQYSIAVCKTLFGSSPMQYFCQNSYTVETCIIKD